MPVRALTRGELDRRLVEGDRQKQIKLDKLPWNAEKIFRKGLKQFLWIIFAAWTLPDPVIRWRNQRSRTSFYHHKILYLHPKIGKHV